MKDRLKQVRKDHPHGKTQETFANYLGVSRDNIASYESGRRAPSDAFISLFCEKCKVNEEWLRSGSGDMKASQTKETQIADLVAKLYGADENSFEFKLAMMLKDMPVEDWQKVKNFIRSLSDSID